MTSVQPLSGTKVLDLSDEAGVFGARLLADLGADVVRLEPIVGDSLRRRGPFLTGGDELESGLAHLLYNAGKRSFSFDPNIESEWETADQLLDWADIAIAPMRKSAAMKRFIDATRLSEHHPHLDVIDIVFRRDAPDMPGSDLLGVAAGGLLWLNGFPGDPPNYPAGNLAYKQCSLVAAFTATALLNARSRGTDAHRVVISMQEAAASTTIQSGNQNVWRWERRSPGRTGGSISGSQSIFQASDGAWLSFVIPPPYWHSYAEWVRETLGDERFLQTEWTEPAFRQNKGEIIAAATRSLCASMPRDQLVESGQRRHLLVCPVNTVADLAADPHLAARGFFCEVPQPAIQRSVVLPASPFRPDGTTVTPRPSPALGQHLSDVQQGVPRRKASRVQESNAGLPLSGIRVLDFCWLIAGPLGTRLLSDLGAEVIKVESTARVDRIREGQIVPPGGATLNTAPVFNDCNTGKKSITLNLGTPEGVALAKRLVAHADIVSSNFTPDRMERWGLGFDALRAIKPDIIVASMPVMGSEGPRSSWGAYGNGIIAMSGISSLTGFPGRPPIGLGTLHSDFTAPYFLATHILAALHHRNQTGAGQFLEIAQYETAINLLDTELVDYLNNGAEPERIGNRHRSRSPHGVFPTARDDEWIVIDVEDDDMWKALCLAMGRSDLMSRVDLERLDGRQANVDEVEEAVTTWAAGRSRDDALAELRATGVLAYPVQCIRDLVEKDGGTSGFFEELEHPECGTMLTQHQPVTWDGHRLPLRRAPLFGEHTQQVLSELLDLGSDDISMLSANGVLK
ncbi:MAG TPA: CoA transferase [Opitutaceae bacterium]|nr:CoA transferase [Opitutaceae bacterium]